ncbi:TetR/AcrR family transcriptional regulator [Streptomyces sp. B1866]|uniref:TetR/AcrR family transcriptional regulator n=1 Tax=Streptomyces sp. B1866 TaxID=3075431 RepID=UPI00288EB6BE|nr:TetR/AcrR family transcriptional regulator [Streptomyces sp. B1866]MDT3397014.1 TetR/AcrR family transcriptional regulator [Streptomyces sp. B1866]
MTSGGERRVTRRRGAELQQAILDAAWAELIEVGYDKTTMAGIAARAGTSKPVLYRRWPRQSALLLDALVRNLAALPDPPDTGELRADVITFLRQIAERLRGVPSDVMASLTAETLRDPGLYARLHEHEAAVALAERVRAMVERAALRGEVPGGDVPPRIAALPVSLLRHDYLVFGIEAAEAGIPEIVDLVFLPLVRKG